METCATGVYPEERREKASVGTPDMSFILPLFPGDVRDADGRQRSGPETPAHPLHSTLSRSVAAFQFDDGSNVVGLACEALRYVLG